MSATDDDFFSTFGASSTPTTTSTTSSTTPTQRRKAPPPPPRPGPRASPGGVAAATSKSLTTGTGVRIGSSNSSNAATSNKSQTILQQRPQPPVYNKTPPAAPVAAFASPAAAKTTTTAAQPPSYNATAAAAPAPASLPTSNAWYTDPSTTAAGTTTAVSHTAAAPQAMNPYARGAGGTSQQQQHQQQQQQQPSYSNNHTDFMDTSGRASLDGSMDSSFRNHASMSGIMAQQQAPTYHPMTNVPSPSVFHPHMSHSNSTGMMPSSSYSSYPGVIAPGDGSNLPVADPNIYKPRQFGFETSSSSNTSSFNFDDEPPLLDELGINLEHIWLKTKAVVVPFRRLQGTHSVLLDPAAIVEDADLAGPLAFALLLGMELLMSVKLSFGYIYGFGLFGCLAMTLILNLMSPTQAVSFWTVTSILGYALLPVNVLAGVAIVTQNLAGWESLTRLLAILTVVWSTTASTRLLEVGCGMTEQRYLLAYPIALLYSAFVLITIF